MTNGSAIFFDKKSNFTELLSLSAKTQFTCQKVKSKIENDLLFALLHSFHPENPQKYTK